MEDQGLTLILSSQNLILQGPKYWVADYYRWILTSDRKKLYLGGLLHLKVLFAMALK